MGIATTMDENRRAKLEKAVMMLPLLSTSIGHYHMVPTLEDVARPQPATYAATAGNQSRRRREASARVAPSSPAGPHASIAKLADTTPRASARSIVSPVITAERNPPANASPAPVGSITPAARGDHVTVRRDSRSSKTPPASPRFSATVRSWPPPSRAGRSGVAGPTRSAAARIRSRRSAGPPRRPSSTRRSSRR